MSRFVSVSLLAAATTLVAACQQMPASRSAQVPPPPAVAGTAAPAQPQAAQNAQAPAVEFRLAQNEKDNGLQPLKLNDRQLWVLPQPVFTRADLQSVTPVKSRDGRAYVRFQFNQAGASKLANVTQRYAGKYLLLTVNGQLASAPTISGPMKDGMLFVPAVNEQQANQIAAAVAGQQAANGGAATR